MKMLVAIQPVLKVARAEVWRPEILGCPGLFIMDVAAYLEVAGAV